MGRRRLSENEKVIWFMALFPLFWPFIPVVLLCMWADKIKEKYALGDRNLIKRSWCRVFHWRALRRVEHNTRIGGNCDSICCRCGARHPLPSTDHFDAYGE
jgi:hypothetical protein